MICWQGQHRHLTVEIVADCFDFLDEVIGKCVGKFTSRNGGRKRWIRFTTTKFVTNTEQLFAAATLCYLRREVVCLCLVNNVCNSSFCFWINLFIDSEASLQPLPLRSLMLAYHGEDWPAGTLRRAAGACLSRRPRSSKNLPKLRFEPANGQHLSPQDKRKKQKSEKGKKDNRWPITSKRQHRTERRTWLTSCETCSFPWPCWSTSCHTLYRWTAVCRTFWQYVCWSPAYCRRCDHSQDTCTHCWGSRAPAKEQMFSQSVPCCRTCDQSGHLYSLLGFSCTWNRANVQSEYALL